MESPRQDIFTVVHKAIRALLYDVGAALQRTEFADAAQADALLARLATTVDMVREHARHESRFIFPEMRRFVPGVIDTLEAEHAAAELKLDALAFAAGVLDNALDPTAREAAGRELNRAFNDFLGAYLSHLHHEEQTVLPATWEHLSDTEIGALRANIQADTDPARYSEWLRWMFSAQTVGELTTLFKGVKLSAPPAMLQQMIDTARKTVGNQRWAAIKHHAGL